MRLLLIRHGQTPSNVARALDTAIPGAGLTPLGQAQARALPAALATEPIAAIYASRLVRTQLTARPLAAARGLAVQIRDGLEEVPAGDLEMLSDEQAVKAYVECLAAWMGGDRTRRMPGGLDGEGFLARFGAAVDHVVASHDPDETVAVFAHGAAIRVFVAYAAGVDPDTATALRIANTGLAALEGSPDEGWRLTRWTTVPLGGPELEDAAAADVTGESVEEVADEIGANLKRS